jgi:hypothetical protein
VRRHVHCGDGSHLFDAVDSLPSRLTVKSRAPFSDVSPVLEQPGRDSCLKGGTNGGSRAAVPRSQLSLAKRGKKRDMEDGWSSTNPSCAATSAFTVARSDGIHESGASCREAAEASTLGKGQSQMLLISIGLRESAATMCVRFLCVCCSLISPGAIGDILHLFHIKIIQSRNHGDSMPRDRSCWGHQPTQKSSSSQRVQQVSPWHVGDIMLSQQSQNSPERALKEALGKTVNDVKWCSHR